MKALLNEWVAKGVAFDPHDFRQQAQSERTWNQSPTNDGAVQAKCVRNFAHTSHYLLQLAYLMFSLLALASLLF